MNKPPIKPVGKPTGKPPGKQSGSTPGSAPGESSGAPAGTSPDASTSAAEKAQIQPAKGSPPKNQNTTGRIVNKTQPQPLKAPTNPRAANYADELNDYLGSVKTPQQVKTQWGELQQAQKAAQAAGDLRGATAAKDALAGLQQKAAGMGMSVKDLPNVGLPPEQLMTLGSAWEMGGDAFAKMATKRAAQYIGKIQAARSKEGGYTPGKGRNANGKCGEWQARRDLESEGFDVIDVQNKSGHGIDVVGRNPKTGDVRVLEVKTTQTDVAPPLTGAGKSMGGLEFTRDRLEKALEGKGHWQNQPELKANAEKLDEWLKDAKRRGAKVTPEKYDVYVEDPDKGCIKRKDSKSSPWEAPSKKSEGKVTPKPRGRK
ncbi:MAG: hypothetical protein EON54_13030 [Alcaligenaceae bacterium]|nr:MAG: hypothetical protein EON54_13030 [Alcaligenaceae bacterium]